MTSADPLAHLTSKSWERANRLLVRKALAEFTHERLLRPEALGGGRYLVRSDDARTTYDFTAQRLSLDHWQVDAESIACRRDGRVDPVDAAQFVLEIRTQLALSPGVLPVYLEEISATLSSMAYKLSAKPAASAAELSLRSFQEIETGMFEGHPCFVANSGRLGFDATEFHSYAPEAAQPVRLVWLAARRTHCTFVGGAGIDYDTLMHTELGADALQELAAAMARLDLSLADYYLVPVHPWQWWNKLSVTFAAEVARRNLVFLGYSADEYLAQQSIRTFFNVSQPEKHYVKTALSVLNMGFMRGLSAAYMAGTPGINDWLADVVASDGVFRDAGFAVLRERASVGYRHEQYEAATEKGSPYRKMLAALWRESPVPQLRPGERLATMAALLHTDASGGSVTAALIDQSGLAPQEWLRRYLDVYLTPLLHSFYAYGIAYMPHGENAILVLDERSVPVRVFVKDIAEEVVVMDPAVTLPDAAERIRVEVPEDQRLLCIFTDVFDGFLRFLNAVLVTAGVLDEETFWSTVASCVVTYQDSVPHLADEFARFDIFAGQFDRSCLNRLQLRDNTQMVDLQDPSSALQLVGTLTNPIAPFAPARTGA